MIDYWHKSKGFCGCYFESIDRPYLENKIFLLFEVNPFDYNIYDDLDKDPWLYCKYKCNINNKPHVVYVLHVKNKKEIDHLMRLDEIHFGKILFKLPLEQYVSIREVQKQFIS